MVLKTFSFLGDDTRLIQHKDTVYKIKLCYKNIAHSQRGEQLQAESEEVLRAVIHFLRNNKSLVKIQTENFRVIPSTGFWKTGEKLGFCRNEKMLKAYKYVIVLTFFDFPCSQGQGTLAAASLTSAARMEAALPESNHYEENRSQNQSKVAQKVGACGRSGAVQSDGSSRSGACGVREAHVSAANNNRSTTGAVHASRPSSQQAVAMDTAIAKQPSSLQTVTGHSKSQEEREFPTLSPSPTAGKTSNRRDLRAQRPGAESSERTPSPQRRSPGKHSPRLGLRSGHQSRRSPPSTVDRERNSNVRYSLRRRPFPEATHQRPAAPSRKSSSASLQNPSRSTSGVWASPRKSPTQRNSSSVRASPTKSPTQRNYSNVRASPRKFPRGSEQNTSRNSNRSPRRNAGRIADDKDSGVGSRAVVRAGARSREQARRGGVHDVQERDDQSSSPVPSTSKRRTRQQLVTLQSKTAASRAGSNNPRQPVLRSPPRLAVVTQPRLVERSQTPLSECSQASGGPRAAEATVELRRAVSRGAAAEQQRLRRLTTDRYPDQGSPAAKRTRAQVFQQKDRYVVESEETREEVKLQTLVSGESETLADGRRTRRKRSSRLFELFEDNVVTPIKRALRGAKGATPDGSV